MNKNSLTHVIAAITIVLGLWLFFAGNDQPAPTSSTDTTTTVLQTPSENTAVSSNKQLPIYDRHRFSSNTRRTPNRNLSPEISRNTSPADSLVDDPKNIESIVDDYIMALRSGSLAASSRAWAMITQCEQCLKLLVNMMVNKELEESIMLKLATNMTELDTNTVLPVFDVMIDPARDRNQAIVLSEKLMKNGRQEFVDKIFEVIFRAQQNGYQDFAQQLTWVVTKLDNQAGIEPILNVITGRTSASEDYAKHVSSIFSKVVQNLPEPQQVANVMADYYRRSDSQEQERLWEVVSRHPDTLVLLAVEAERNGQTYSIQKYAAAMARLPDEHSVDGLMKLHVNIEYAPDYLVNMLIENIKFNPTVRKLHKLEDYMRDPGVDLESRFFAAEGLLAVRENRHARYILEKVIKNSQYADPELQAYIGGRL